MKSTLSLISSKSIFSSFFKLGNFSIMKFFNIIILNLIYFSFSFSFFLDIFIMSKIINNKFSIKLLSISLSFSITKDILFNIVNIKFKHSKTI